MANNFGCYIAVIVKYIAIVVFCVPTHDESFGSVTGLSQSTSGEGLVVGPCGLYNGPSVYINARNVANR
jgi:hypothetical protein